MSSRAVVASACIAETAVHSLTMSLPFLLLCLTIGDLKLEEYGTAIMDADKGEYTCMPPSQQVLTRVCTQSFADYYC